MPNSDYSNEISLLFDNLASEIVEIKSNLIRIGEEEILKRDKRIKQLEELLEEKERQNKNLKEENDILYKDLIKMEEDSYEIQNTASATTGTLGFSNAQANPSSIVDVDHKNEQESENRPSVDDQVDRLAENLSSSLKTDSREGSSNSSQIPESLLENNKFSLSKFLKKKAKKPVIVEEFKILIMMIAFDTYEDDEMGALSFLDIKESEREPDIEARAMRRWSESVGVSAGFLGLSDEIDKMPQKNRYKDLIENIERLIS